MISMLYDLVSLNTCVYGGGIMYYLVIEFYVYLINL